MVYILFYYYIILCALRDVRREGCLLEHPCSVMKRVGNYGDNGKVKLIVFSLGH